MQRTYPNGVPCWIDTLRADPDAACAFYAELLGWAFTDPLGDGGYRIATLHGSEVGAVARGRAGGSAAWKTYIAVDDVADAVARVTAGGGRVITPPEDVGPGGRAGRMAVCADPAGVEFRLWQAGALLGAQLVNAPGAWNFSDLHTADPAAARRFYTAVFGWEHTDTPGGSAMWRVPGYGDHLAAGADPAIHDRQAAVGAPPEFADVVAGLAAAGPQEPDHWHVTFSVADRDEAAATAQRLGAEVLDRRDSAWTKTVLVRDPQGGVVSLSQFAPRAG